MGDFLHKALFVKTLTAHQGVGMTGVPHIHRAGELGTLLAIAKGEFRLDGIPFPGRATEVVEVNLPEVDDDGLLVLVLNHFLDGGVGFRGL